ncbi:hypothetical protein AVEN_132665-1 [Araneus ventricosus]|uniref:Uncharacterized protein n=1 Tax=Araneus ventricosus TaxID=182803 RepID=A0A4Y2AUN5_ARAVE|nr:hypothetical protein AVEN_132665-1 [Araneus ventricosus]
MQLHKLFGVQLLAVLFHKLIDIMAMHLQSPDLGQGHNLVDYKAPQALYKTPQCHIRQHSPAKASSKHNEFCNSEALKDELSLPLEEHLRYRNEKLLDTQTSSCLPAGYNNGGVVWLTSSLPMTGHASFERGLCRNGEPFRAIIPVFTPAIQRTPELWQNRLNGRDSFKIFHCKKSHVSVTSQLYVITRKRNCLNGIYCGEEVWKIGYWLRQVDEKKLNSDAEERARGHRDRRGTYRVFCIGGPGVQTPGHTRKKSPAIRRSALQRPTTEQETWRMRHTSAQFCLQGL